MATFRDLLVWQRAMDLAVDIYKLTSTFPASETFGLSAQARRAAASVAFNVAEGQARLHRGDFIRHLSFARGSLAELETQVELALRLGYATPTAATPVAEAIAETGRLLNGLLRQLEQGDRPQPGQRHARPADP